MGIHYYSGWFEKEIPENMIKLMRQDIKDKKSLAIIWGWYLDENFEVMKELLREKVALEFEEYTEIDANLSKEEASLKLREASVIVLMGGYTTIQNNFIWAYDLQNAIKENHHAIIIGFSAGAKNMSQTSICKLENGYVNEKNGIYKGLGLDNFCFEPYFSVENKRLIEKEILPLSMKTPVYATTKESFLRVKDGKVEVYGKAYRIVNGKIEIVL